MIVSDHAVLGRRSSPHGNEWSTTTQRGIAGAESSAADAHVVAADAIPEERASVAEAPGDRARVRIEEQLGVVVAQALVRRVASRARGTRSAVRDRRCRCIRARRGRCARRADAWRSRHRARRRARGRRPRRSPRRARSWCPSRPRLRRVERRCPARRRGGRALCPAAGGSGTVIAPLGSLISGLPS